MKKLMSIMLIMLVALMPFAFAQEASVTTEEENGIMPDSILYGLDKALDRISLALASDKPGKGLEIAKERIFEAKKMAEKANEKGLLKAAKSYNSSIAAVEKAIEEIESNGDAEKAKQAMEKISELQNKVESHYQKVAEIKDEILERQRKVMGAEQIAHLEEVFSRIKERAREMENKADTKKENAKTKYKALSNKSENKVNAEERAIDEKTGLTAGRKERANEMIAKAEDALQNARIRLGQPEVMQSATSREKSFNLGAVNEAAGAQATNAVLSREEIDAIMLQIEDLQNLISRAKEASNEKIARDIAEEINDFGYDISVAKKIGEITSENMREKYKAHKKIIVEKSRSEGGQ
ncbi:hypothetical protein J4463_01340 [Candidatus Pacearchaeota archaeon]|nr:hypothetical protein [Candidatus Pacearchaeota archaeon]